LSRPVPCLVDFGQKLGPFFLALGTSNDRREWHLSPGQEGPLLRSLSTLCRKFGNVFGPRRNPLTLSLSKGEHPPCGRVPAAAVPPSRLGLEPPSWHGSILSVDARQRMPRPWWKSPGSARVQPGAALPYSRPVRQTHVASRVDQGRPCAQRSRNHRRIEGCRPRKPSAQYLIFVPGRIEPLQITLRQAQGERIPARAEYVAELTTQST